MAFDTELTRRLGISVPVVQGGMQWVGYAELASAVSNAGGLGILTSLTQPTPEDLRKEIRKCQTMTQKPFGVNLTCLPTINPPPYQAYADVIIEEGIKIVETAGLVQELVPMFKKAGCTVLHKCTTIRHALSAQKLDVDFLSIDGFECAGHIGETDIPNFILLSRARQELKTPFIASGGFVDGFGLAGALALGACGINMGTRFLCTVEAPVHHNIKESIVKATENDTQLVLRRWKNTSRYFRNKVSEQAYRIEKESLTGEFKEVQEYVSGQRGRQVFLNGDPDYGVWTAGICIGLIHDIPTCEALLRRIKRKHPKLLTVSFRDSMAALGYDIARKCLQSFKLLHVHHKQLYQDQAYLNRIKSNVESISNQLTLLQIPRAPRLVNRMYWVRM